MAALSPPHPDALAAPARAALDLLGRNPLPGGFYLAGSAALALHLGHRRAASLDLMSGTNRLTGPERRDLLAALLATEPATRVETARDGYLHARFGEVPLKLYHYPYPPVDPPRELAGVAVVSLADLGLMKLGAIISRGTRRDFVDLYLLCRRLPLAELLARSGEKYGHVRDFPLQALKGLADLSLVAGEPMPPLASPLAWEEVETWLAREVRSLGRERLGLDAVTGPS